MTMATWVSSSTMPRICCASRNATAGSMLKWPSPISASPLSLSKMRPYRAVAMVAASAFASLRGAGARLPRSRHSDLFGFAARRLQVGAQLEPGEAADDDVFAELGDRFGHQVADRS